MLGVERKKTNNFSNWTVEMLKGEHTGVTPSIQVQLCDIMSRTLASRRPCTIDEKLTAFMYANAFDAHDNDEDNDDDDGDNASKKWL